MVLLKRCKTTLQITFITEAATISETSSKSHILPKMRKKKLHEHGKCSSLKLTPILTWQGSEVNEKKV